MGFGYLLVGYLFFLNIGVYEGLTNLLGYVLMAYGLLKLYRFNNGLRASAFIMIPLILFGLFHFTVTAMELLSLFTPSPSLMTSVAILSRLLIMAFTAALLIGIRDLAIETGIPVLRGRASRNRFLTYVYYILAAVLEMTAYTPEATAFAVAAAIPVTVFGFVTILLNVQVLHNAYRWICMPEDIAPLVEEKIPDEEKGEHK